MRSFAFRLTMAALTALWAALPASAEWRSLRTNAFLLFYPASQETLALETLAALEAARPRVEALTGGGFRRLPVVLEDIGTYSNGLADPVFRRVELYPYEPAPTMDIGFSESWLRSLVVHELTHIGQLQAASGLPAVARAIFGPLLATGLLSPAWLAEGLAVYTESSFSPYEGRLNEGTFDALVGLRARDGALPSLGKVTFSEEAYPFGNGSYLYGASFVRYLAERGGEQALAAFLASYARSPLSYLSPLLPLVGLDRAALDAFGARLPELWREWRDREEAREAPSAAEKMLGSPGAAEIGCAVLSDGELSYARTDEVKTGVESYQAASRIVRLERDGAERVLLRTPSRLSCAFRIRGDWLTYALLEYEGGHPNVTYSGLGITSVLRRRDLRTGRDRELLRAPLRCFTVLEDGRVLYAVDSADGHTSALWEYRPGDGAPRLLRDFPLKVFEMASDETTLVLCARGEGTNTDLYRIGSQALRDGELEPLVRSPWSEKSISLEHGILRYSTNPGGEHQAWGMDTRDGTSWRYDTGPYAVWPCEDVSSGTLAYVGLTSSGPRIMEVPSRRLDAAPAAEEAPEEAEAASEPSLPAGVERLGYWPNLLTLVPRIRLPLLTTDFHSLRLGVWLHGESALGDIAYDIRGEYATLSRTAALTAYVDISPAAPISLALSYSSSAAHEIAATLSLIPFAGLQSGVSSVRLALTAAAQNALTRLEIEPSFTLGYRAPWIRGTLGASLWLDRAELGFEESSLGIDGTAWLRAALLGGEITALAEVGWEPGGQGVLVSPVRGHSSGPEGSPAGFGRLAYDHILLKMRSGLWNPSVYLGDLVAGAFVEGAVSTTAHELAAGIEGTLEARLFSLSTGLSITLGGWIGIDEGLGFIYGYSLSGDIPLLSGRLADAGGGGTDPLIRRGKVER